MTTQTALPVSEIAAGFEITTEDGFYGTVTTRRTTIGDVILVTQQGTWIPVTPNTLATIDPNSADAVGNPAWGERDGCPMGTPEMGCDMAAGCIGECGASLINEVFAEDLINVYDPAGGPLDMPIFSGRLMDARKTLQPGVYPGSAWAAGKFVGLFVQIAENGVTDTFARG